MEHKNLCRKVRLKLTAKLAKLKSYAEAKFEYEATSEKIVGDQKAHPDLAEFLNSDWFQSTTPVTDNKQLYRREAEAANHLLIEGIPLIDANLGDVFRPKDRPALQKFFIRHDAKLLEIVDHASKFKNVPKRMGAPISVRGEWLDSRHFKIYEVEAREQGEHWDLVPLLVGVVDHVIQSKKLLHIIIDKQRDAIVRFSELQDRFSVGDPIAVRLPNVTRATGSKFELSKQLKHGSKSLNIYRPSEKNTSTGSRFRLE